MLVTMADPGKLRQRLHKATSKKIDLLILPQAAKPQPPIQVNADVPAPATAIAAQALLSQRTDQLRSSGAAIPVACITADGGEGILPLLSGRFCFCLGPLLRLPPASWPSTVGL
ncbi:hypothetical protein ABZP36_025197 [Zizania latifolia]